MGFDRVIIEVDKTVRTLFAQATTVRPRPGKEFPEADLSEVERRHVIGLMRVNHVGEICAQALYQGQALTSRNSATRDALVEAANEEIEHLAWTEQRIYELKGRKSCLNLFWYSGAFALGTLAGEAGDRWNLGFLVETERQVEAHLNSHLRELPLKDLRSRAIVEQMRLDEIKHAEMALELGGSPLPMPIVVAMKFAARFMTRTAYYA